MIAMLAVKVTAVLIVGVLALTFAPRRAAKIRHLICTLTVAVSLMLPLLLRYPILPAEITFSVSASALGVPAAAMPLRFTYIWACGAMLLTMRFLAGSFYLSWKTRRAAGDRRIRFGSVESPLVWGLFRPVILMPTSAAGWTNERWALAIAHEEAHIQRGDLWTSAFAAIAEAMYWFHPLMWWVTYVMRQEQELACDEQVLEQGHSCTSYAELLIATAGMPESAPLGCRMSGGAMKVRLERILTWRHVSGSTRTKQWMTGAACIGCLVVCALLAPAASERGPYRIGGDVTSPQLIEKHEPEYTKDARDNKVQGVVVLSVVISETGVPTDVHVVKSLDSGLDQKAVDAVSSWRFKPATKKGQPVSVSANIEVHFRLLDNPPQAPAN